MTKVIFRFDTEDFVNKNAADGVLRVINVLEEYGVRGVFVIVGKFAEALRDWGRTDIIEALSRHEIGIHSLGHSIHPTINEYTDHVDYSLCLRRFREKEGECLRILKDVFGIDRIYAACGPGSSVSYVMQYGYTEMGVPLHLGAGSYYGDTKAGRPTKYANAIQIPTAYGLDTLETYTKADIDKMLDDAATRYDTLCFCHHPAMNMVKVFYDKLNFDGKNTPEEKWVLSPEKTKEEQATWLENFRYLVERIVKDERFTVTTGKEISETYYVEERVIDKETLRKIKPQLDEELFPITTPDSFCLTDILYACRDLLLGKPFHVCGSVYGFLSEPYATQAPVTLTRDALCQVARQIGDTFIPAKFLVGDTEIGPADFLRAAITLLCEGGDAVTVAPAPVQIDLNEFPVIKDMTLSGGWIHSPDFKDHFVSDRIRFQTWTIHFPKGTKRKVF